MRAALAITMALAVSGVAGIAAAEDDPFAGAATISGQDLTAQRGGTDNGDVTNSVLQGNTTSQTGTNSNSSITVGGYAAKVNGQIREATVTGNHGITAVMQNTGDLVNMNNATSVNVFLQ